MSTFAENLEAARRQAKPAMALRRHTAPDLDGLMDDVVVETPSMFRAEQMSDRHLWMACYFPNDERICFSVYAGKGRRLEFDVTEWPECGWFDIDSGEERWS